MANRKGGNEGLPKGVYRSGGKFIGQYTEGGKLHYVGIFSTPEACEYRLQVAQYGTHWKGIEDGPYIGFIYLVTNKRTGKRYVGKRQMFYWQGPKGGYKCTDMESEWWEPEAWYENEWRFYTGSQVDLNKELLEGNIWDFEYEVIQMCRTQLDLHVAEETYQIEHDVLEAIDEDGEYLWYNKNIAGIAYRAPFRKHEVIAQRAIDEEAIAQYYLKPNLCLDCGSVLSFGNTSGTCCTVSRDTKDLEFDPLIVIGGGFTDVR